MVYKEEMELSSLNIYRTKNQQKWIRGEKVTAPPWSRGLFLQKILNWIGYSIFSNLLEKSLNITLLSLELQHDL
jgi:hypothetical protein